ncbi:hypothetical protein Lfu02_42400 [Longispora fulva]|uniref:Uncharacterized protein n=1 Tax=Longispora fulva TaxID=619741 RepID=A0A8J7KJA1_9ACTN|nr:hypothetical protein [Longispora fulva]MBG6136699.1 hypothetical protein [Longispora fulva]GIG59868.1 hypothetical protein Lfu02_42400 [Longispora fulva]
MTSLIRRYRLLLRAYPSDFRRQHGEELLDTLLAAAPPDRRRPTPRETANLLRHGLRRHLGRPRSRVIVLVAVLFALVTGFLGTVGGVWASWSAVRDLPDAAASAALAETVFPGGTPVRQMRNDAPFFYDDPTSARTLLYGADDYTPGRVEFDYKGSDQTADADAFTRAAGDRLRAAGWRIAGTRVGDGEHHSRGVTLWAEKDDLLIELSDSTDSGGYVDLTVVRSPQWWMWPAGIAGGVAGALGGWLLLGWVSRRIQGRLIRQPLVIVLGLVAGNGILPALSLCWFAVRQVLTRTDPGQPIPLWFGLVYLGRFPALVAAAAVLCAVGLAALPHRRVTDRAPVA